jgi:transposase-like protein
VTTESQARQHGVIALVCGGLTVAEAARQLGVPRRTVYTWKGHDPTFRRQLAAAQRGQRVLDTELPDRGELLGLLAVQAREGSVRAIDLLLRQALDAERAPKPLPEVEVEAPAKPSGPFDEVDELAHRRRHAG